MSEFMRGERMENNCEYLKEDGMCKRTYSPCRASARKELLSVEENEGEYVKPEEICKKNSPYGNICIALEAKDIDRILRGEILRIPGEYDVFVGTSEEVAKCNCSPCYDCRFRKILAAGFDRNVWGKDCPRFGERGVCVLSENDIHGDTDGIPYHVNG